MTSNKGGARPGAGRKPTGHDKPVGTSISADDLAAIDAWAAKRGCSRAEAIRRLVKLGLLSASDDD
jgi:Ribbon-helix-helix protein, copG family